MAERKKKPTIGLVGGDQRQYYLYRLYQEDGYEVLCCGMEQTDLSNVTLDLLMAKAEVLLLPLPVASGKFHLFTPLSGEQIPLSEIEKRCRPGMRIYGGMLKGFLSGFGAQDYFDKEDLQIKNAIPTAEGALECAMRELPITLNQSRCLVTGFGRIGKVLCSKLKGLDAQVCVAARKIEDLELAKALGYCSVPMSRLGQRLSEFDLVFNTVPHQIFDERVLKQAGKDTLLMDLASLPGGFDLDAVRRLGLFHIQALSLPGKTSPKTAAQYIKETIDLMELEVTSI